MNDPRNGSRWLDQLSDEDIAFLKRFVLAGGSLKDTAEAYGVTYPTVRLRLDRLIEKIKVLDSLQIVSPFERLARAAFADGKIDLETMRTLLNAHNTELENRHAKPTS
jgi:hypothetical protein